MSENTTISAEKRERVGKGSARAVRRAGRVPAVIYGDKKDPLGITLESREISKIVHQPGIFGRLLDIQVDGEKNTVLTRDIQFHPVTDRIIHVDFYQIFDDKEITMNIPVRLTGTSPGVLNGGSLRFTNRKLRVKALPANLPDFVTADISELKIGSKLLISSIVNDVYTFMHPENTVVVQVRTSRNATAEDEEEGTEEAKEAAAE